MITAASRLVCSFSIGRLALQPTQSELHVYHMLGPQRCTAHRTLSIVSSRLNSTIQPTPQVQPLQMHCLPSHIFTVHLDCIPSHIVQTVLEAYKMLVLAALRTCRCSTGLLFKQIPLCLLCDPVEPCVLQNIRQSVQNGKVRKPLCKKEKRADAKGLAAHLSAVMQAL